jgi:hypothetical protein
VPGAGSDATLPGSSAYTVLFDTDAVIGGLDGTDALATLDVVALVGYGQELAADLAARQTSAAGTMLTLSDRTTIFFQDAGALTAQPFLSLP